MDPEQFSARGQLVRCLTPDRLELHGFLAEPASPTSRKGIVVHIHGQFNNFYRPHFVGPLSRAITDAGFSFLAVNTRALEFSVELRRYQSNGSSQSERPFGGSHEIFSDGVRDLEGWLKFACELSERVILMGHSHGALKATHYLDRGERAQKIAATVLLSPSDDVGTQRKALGKDFDTALAIARSMVGKGEANSLMPDWAYGYPISAAAYVDMFSYNADLAIFRFDEPTEGFRELGHIDVPTFVAFGSHDVATSSVDSHEAIKLIRAALPPSTPFSGTVIADASHTFAGHEEELARVIVDWLQGTFD